MKARVEIGGRVVDFKHLEPSASVVEVEPGVYSVLTGGHSHEVRVERNSEGLAVTVAGRRFLAEVRDPRRLARKPRSFSGEGRQQVTAPMPGKVVRLLVAEGDRVEAGQGLLVVEAMKMQNEMRAPKAGCVVALPVGEGATVGAGELLAAIE